MIRTQISLLEPEYAAAKAEARRLARFEGHGHTTGGYQLGVETPHPEFPHTLDLRRAPGV